MQTVVQSGMILPYTLTSQVLTFVFSLRRNHSHPELATLPPGQNFGENTQSYCSPAAARGTSRRAGALRQAAGAAQPRDGEGAAAGGAGLPRGRRSSGRQRSGGAAAPGAGLLRPAEPRRAGTHRRAGNACPCRDGQPCGHPLGSGLP